MKDAFGTELKIGQTVVMSRGRRGYLAKGKIYKIVSEQSLETVWNWNGRHDDVTAHEEKIVDRTRVYWKRLPDDTQSYTSYGYVKNSGKVVVIG